MEQMSLFQFDSPPQFAVEQSEPDLAAVDLCIVAMSGGKDSLASLLLLFDLGVPKEKIELWHHDIDGREGSRLMDWPCTRDYCRAVAEALGIPIYYSWKMGGFEQEMLRENALTAPTAYETPDGIMQSGGIRGTLSTRRKFPQVSANLSVRWCSAYLKIDVCSKAITGQARLTGKNILLVTGERAQESASRAGYCGYESHKTSGLKRTVNQWRPVHQWTEEQVWEIIERYRVNPHPAYRLGWGRVSCAACIFGSKDQWASLAAINQPQINRIAAYETEFGVTINRNRSVMEMVSAGMPYANMDPKDITSALSDSFDEPVILPEGTWKLPAGAFGENCGPT